jgi:hypothetical protein
VIYLDGSALCRFLPGVRHGEAWREWVKAHKGDIVTSQLSLTELRQAAALYPREALDEVTTIVDEVRDTVPLIRFSDNNVTISSHATAVLKPFAALHIGAAAGDEKVDGIATYDPSLAHVAEIYRLKVVTPGLNAKWYLDFEGPVEGWTPIALDAPYDPGGEYAIAPAERRPDAFERALREVEERAVAAKAEPKEEAKVVRLETESLGAGLGEEEILRETTATWELTEDGDFVPTESTAQTLDAADGSSAPEETAEPSVPVIEISEPADTSQESVVVLEPVSESPVVPEPVSESPEVLEPMSESPVVLEPAQETTGDSAQVASVNEASTPPMAPPSSVAETPAEESEASKRRAEMIARLGAYTPKVEAWRDAEGAEAAAPAPPKAPQPLPTPETIPAPKPAPSAPTAPLAPEVPAATVPEPAQPPQPTPMPERPVVPVSASAPEPSTEPPVAPVPDRVKGVVPPVSKPGAQPSGPMGEPVFRPMMEQGAQGSAQRETSRASTEAPGASQVPLPLHVEFDERQSYAPSRIETSGARPLPGSHPFARAGQTEAMAAPPVPIQRVPALEPLSEEPPPSKPLATPFIEKAAPEDVPKPPVEEEKGSRRRRGKAKDQKKANKGEVAAPPSEQGEGDDPGWRLDDILGPDGGKK